MTSPDRVLVLEPTEGKIGKNAQGIVDPSLFTGGNQLHAKMDMESCLWTLHYEKGSVPPVLNNQRFTSFSKAKKAAEEYFAKRNIQVTTVKHT